MSVIQLCFREEGSKHQLQALNLFVCVRMRLCVSVSVGRVTIFSCNVQPTSNPTAQQALLPKAYNVNKLYLTFSNTHRHTCASSDTLFVNQSQGSVLCPKILILSRRQAPLESQTKPTQSSLTITSPCCQLKNQEGQTFRVQIVQSDPDRSEIGPIFH